VAALCVNGRTLVSTTRDPVPGGFAALRRFKLTGTGKVLYAQRGKRHGMIKRTNKQIRNLRGTATLFEGDAANVKKYFLPNG
jgi:large subunit ribosomal protein L35